MGNQARELRDIRHAPGHDPNCAVCHRRSDRRYMDDIWRSAKERFERLGPTSVRITPGKGAGDHVQ